MASSDSMKACENDKDICKRQVRALCFHCSKHLCRIHLLEHAQLIEENTQTELHLLADKFNELSSAFKNLSVSSNILEKPFVELEKWRLDTHEKIDLMAELKRQEIYEKIQEYRRMFDITNKPQLEKMNSQMKTITQLIKDTDATSEQIKDLQTSIHTIEEYLASLNTHTISVVKRLLTSFIDIDTQFFDLKFAIDDKIREFKVNYVRLNGVIRTYSILTDKDGTMADLINAFIEQYDYYGEVKQSTVSFINTMDHKPQLDYILPIEIYNHRAHLQYNNDRKLSNIAVRDIITFYETPHSLIAKSYLHILMPCLFRNRHQNENYGIPLYISVPRRGCQGKDIRDSLHEKLQLFFSLYPIKHEYSYEASLNTLVNGTSTARKLDDVLQDKIDLIKVNATLILTCDQSFTEAFNLILADHLRS